jgi:hypothetical protein
MMGDMGDVGREWERAEVQANVVKEVKPEPLDSIMRGAYNTRSNELWNKITEEIITYANKQYNDVNDLNNMLSEVKGMVYEYNEIHRRLGSRDPLIKL